MKRTLLASQKEATARDSRETWRPHPILADVVFGRPLSTASEVPWRPLYPRQVCTPTQGDTIWRRHLALLGFPKQGLACPSPQPATPSDPRDLTPHAFGPRRQISGHRERELRKGERNGLVGLTLAPCYPTTAPRDNARSLGKVVKGSAGRITRASSQSPARLHALCSAMPLPLHHQNSLVSESHP